MLARRCSCLKLQSRSTGVPPVGIDQKPNRSRPHAGIGVIPRKGGRGGEGRGEEKREGKEGRGGDQVITSSQFPQTDIVSK